MRYLYATYNDHRMAICLFVCLFNRSVRADTRMGPEGTKLEQKPEPDFKAYSMWATPNNQGEQFCL